MQLLCVQDNKWDEIKKLVYTDTVFIVGIVRGDKLSLKDRKKGFRELTTFWCMHAILIFVVHANQRNRDNLHPRNNLYPLYGNLLYDNSFTLSDSDVGGYSGMLAMESTSSPSLVLHNVSIYVYIYTTPIFSTNSILAVEHKRHHNLAAAQLG